MSTIAASFMALNFNENSSTFASAPVNPDNTDASFSGMLNLAEISLSPTAGGQASGFDALLSLTNQAAPANTDTADGNFSQIFALLQQVMSAMENTLSGIDSTGTQTADSTTGTSSPDGLSSGALRLMAEGGPLPAFLNAMDSQGNLSPIQQQSLWNITAGNMSHPNTKTIAAELQQAGIPETIPAGIQV